MTGARRAKCPSQTPQGVPTYDSQDPAGPVRRPRLSNAPGREAFGQDTIRSKTNLPAEGGRESALHLAGHQRPIGQVTYTVWYRHPGGRYWYVYATTRNYGIALDVKLTLQRWGSRPVSSPTITEDVCM